MNVSQT